MPVNPNTPQVTDAQVARFWDKVILKENVDECWIWSARRNSANYGVVYVSGRHLAAHRLSFFLHTGIWSQLYICHRCDNPPCVNPHHLFEGSALDNARDAKSKGRMNQGDPMVRARGEHHGLSKLTKEIALAVCASNESSAILAKRYNVHLMTIRDIRKGRTWSHVTGLERIPPPPKRKLPQEDVSHEISFFELLLFLWHEAQTYKITF